MSCPRIVSPSLAIAVAFGCFALCLSPCCLAAAAIDTKGLTQELLVPFNDLLPPLSDAEFQEAQATSTTTTSTTTAAPPVTEAPVSKPTTTRAPTKVTTPKPTKSATAQKLKKTQYQLDQQSQKPPLAVPILDLNPEVPPALPEAEAPVASQVTEAPVTPQAEVVSTTTTTQAPSTTRAPLTTTKAPVKVSEPKQAASTQHFQRVQTAQTQLEGLEQHRQPQQQQQQSKLQSQQQQQQQYKPQPQQQQQQFAKQASPQPTAQHRFKPQVAAAITKVAPPSPQRSAPAATQVNVEHLRQYLEYIYHPTTRRPSRGPLPTLTPFPRHFK